MTKAAARTLTLSVMHLVVAFTVAYVLTRDWRAALSIGMVEPLYQTMAFEVHERAWARVDMPTTSARRPGTPALGQPFDCKLGR